MSRLRGVGAYGAAAFAAFSNGFGLPASTAATRALPTSTALAAPQCCLLAMTQRADPHKISAPTRPKSRSPDIGGDPSGGETSESMLRWNVFQMRRCGPRSGGSSQRLHVPEHHRPDGRTTDAHIGVRRQQPGFGDTLVIHLSSGCRRNYTGRTFRFGLAEVRPVWGGASALQRSTCL